MILFTCVVLDEFLCFSVLAYVSISLFWRSFFIYFFLSFVLHVFPSVFLAFVLSFLSPPQRATAEHTFSKENAADDVSQNSYGLSFCFVR